MRFIDRNDQGDTRIDLTPLVDTVFLLLIFFMLSSAFVITPGIKVELPKAAYERVFREKKEIRVSITRKNRIYVDRKRVNLKELEKIIRDEGVTAILLGYPLNMDGSVGESAARSERFREILIRRFRIPVRLMDERLSSVQARRAFPPGARKDWDRISAVLILQAYLDQAEED